MPFFVYVMVLTNKIRLLQGKPACEKDLSMAYRVFFVGMARWTLNGFFLIL